MCIGQVINEMCNNIFMYNFRLLTATVEPCQVINCNCFSFSSNILCMHLMLFSISRKKFMPEKNIYRLHLNTNALHMNNLKIETFYRVTFFCGLNTSGIVLSDCWLVLDILPIKLICFPTKLMSCLFMKKKSSSVLEGNV